jgi:hypothetical protein
VKHIASGSAFFASQKEQPAPEKEIERRAAAWFPREVIRVHALTRGRFEQTRETFAALAGGRGLLYCHHQSEHPDPGERVKTPSQVTEQALLHRGSDRCSQILAASAMNSGRRL